MKYEKLNRVKEQKKSQVRNLNDFNLVIISDNNEEKEKKIEVDKELFLWKPNGFQNMTENIIYNTDTSESFNGNEQRIPLLQQPRNRFSYYYTLLNEELQKFNNFLFRNQAKEIQLPIWQDVIFLKEDINIQDTIYFADFKNRRFQNNSKFIMINKNDMSDYVIYNIDNLDIDRQEMYKSGGFDRFWSKGSLMLPIFDVMIKDSVNKVFPSATDRVAGFDLTFQRSVSDLDVIVDSNSLYNKYKTLFIIDKQPNRRENVTQRWQRKLLEVDLGYGKVQTYDKSNQPFNAYNYNWTFKNRQELNDFKTFVKKIKGKLTDFWFPTFENNMTSINKDYESIDNYIIVNDTGLYETYLDREIHIKINFKNRSFRAFEILSIEKDLEGEKLTLDGMLGSDFNSSDIDSINLLFKCRFNTDEFLFLHLTNDQAELSKTAFMQKFD